MKLPQLSLRELFLLVVIAAMGCGWWVEYRRHANDAEAMRESRAEAEEWKFRTETLIGWVKQRYNYSRVTWTTGGMEIDDGKSRYLYDK
jgi:hypothetical protein